MNKTIADALKTASDLSSSVAPNLSGPAKVIAQVTGIALAAASGFAAAGDDPVVKIQRLLSAEPGLKRVEDSWNSELDAKFGPKK